MPNCNLIVQSLHNFIYLEQILAATPSLVYVSSFIDSELQSAVSILACFITTTANRSSQ